MAGRSDKQAGSALGAVLGRRESANQDAAGRSLLLALVRLNALGGLTFDSAGAVHGDGAVAEPSTVGTPCEPVGIARRVACHGGGRVDLDGSGAVVGSALQTAASYNIGSLSASEVTPGEL